MTGRDLRTLFAHAAAGADPRADAELLAQAGDPAAFAALVRRHGPLVWGTCRRMQPDPADAADAFQAVFLALARSAGRVRTPAALGGWLHAAAVRVCLKQRRDAARRRLRETKAARPEAVVPVADVAWDAILAAVHEEVEGLPHGERTAFVLCELQGVPHAEAAARLGWKPGTLTGRLSRARARLLTRLSARGFAPAVGLAGAGVLAVPAEVAALAAGCVGPVADVSPAVVALSREVTQMLATKHLAAAVLVAGGLAAGVGGGLMRADAQGPGGALGPPAAQPDPKPPAGGGFGRPGMPGAPGGLPGAGAYPGMGEGDPPVGGEPGDAGRQWPKWQYKYDRKPEKRAEFVKLLADRGQEGWEFAAVVPVIEEPAGTTGGMGMGGPPGRGGMMGPGGEGGMPGTMPGMGGGPAATVSLVVFKRPATPPRAERPAGGQRENAAREDLDLQLATSKAAAAAVAAHPVGRQLVVVADSGGRRLTLYGPRDAVLVAVKLVRELDSRQGAFALDAAGNAEPITPGGGGADALKTIAGFKVIALKHAKAVDVARTVRELYPEPQVTGGGPQMLGAVRTPQLVVSADDARNLVLFRVGPGLMREPTEKTVRDLVAELDVPAR